MPTESIHGARRVNSVGPDSHSTVEHREVNVGPQSFAIRSEQKERERERKSSGGCE